jgi:tetratricopeptide (TPR) repeat protein
MRNTITTLILFLFIATAQITFAQNNPALALSKGQEAIRFMDSGQIDESIALLKQAQNLDPNRFDYPYEIAYAHYLKKDYKKSIKILEKNKNHKDVTERLFQLLGNGYDLMGKSDKAFKAYDEGLVKFPKSGMIYLEKGNVYWGKEDYDKALAFYEKGIEVDPRFPSNYYRAALLYCGSNESVWGMIYGEIFMNLERNTKRTVEISKLLYDTYKSQIKFTSDTTMTSSFCQKMSINASAFSDPKNFKLPFCMVYGPTMMMAVAMEKRIDLGSLHNIRKSFIENYFINNFHTKYPNILFDYHDQALKAGHFEAYNHWILMMGDEDGFEKWQSTNKDKWDSFVKWFTTNGLEVSEDRKFHSGQY